MNNLEERTYTIYLSNDDINRIDSMLQKTLTCKCLVFPNVNDKLSVYEGTKYACITHGFHREYLITKIETVINKPDHTHRLLHLTELSRIN